MESPKLPSTLALSALLAIFLGSSFYLFLYQPLQSPLLDFSIYYEAGQRIEDGKEIYRHRYEHLAHDGRSFELSYLYPPTFAAAFSLLGKFGEETAKLVWCTISYLCILGSAFLLYFFARSRVETFAPLSLFTLVLGVVVCFEPLYWGAMMGQVDSLVLFLLSAVLLALQREKKFLAALCLSLAAIIKISPALIALLFLLKRDYRSFCIFLFGIGVLCLLTIPGTGLQPFLDFVVSLPELRQGKELAAFVFNFATVPAVLDVFSVNSDSGAAYLLQLFLVSLMFFLLFRVKECSLRFGILVVFMLLFSPILWFHHLCWLMLPIVILFCEQPNDVESRYRHWTICAAFVFLTTQVNLFHYQVFQHLPGALPLSALMPSLIMLCLAFILSRARSGKSL